MEEPKIIFENKDLVAVDKPSGLIVHHVRIAAGKKRREEEPALTDWLTARYPEMKRVGDDPEMRPGIVHRLDKETSGIMVAARTQAAFEALKSLFQSGGMRKKYLALVVGVPKDEKGTIDRPIGIKTGTLKRSIHAKTMVKPAVTEYTVMRKFGSEYALVEARPRTGRTHQIRVHLASIGHPIVGDAMYGKKQGKTVPASRLMLHAKTLEFSYSGGGTRMEFEAPPPKDFQEVIHNLAG